MTDVFTIQDNTAPFGLRAPDVAFPYTMHTTAVMEHSRGVAWVADLYLRDVKIGVIEQAGDGSADRVTFLVRAYQIVWDAAVAEAFAGDEESATFWLLCQEEEMVGDANA